MPKPQTGSKAKQRAKLLKIIHAKNYKAKAREVEGSIDGMAHYQFQMGTDWTVPGTVLTPEQPKGTALLISDTGRKSQAVRVKGLLAKNQRVIAFDPFFFGESKIKSRDFLHVILMHAVGERALGVQSGQIAAVADWAKQEFGGTVTLHSSGPRLSVSARLAAVQTKAIASVEMEQPMKSLKEVITANKGANHLPELMCHGLLEIFDLEQIKELNQ